MKIWTSRTKDKEEMSGMEQKGAVGEGVTVPPSPPTTGHSIPPPQPDPPAPTLDSHTSSISPPQPDPPASTTAGHMLSSPSPQPDPSSPTTASHIHTVPQPQPDLPSHTTKSPTPSLPPPQSDTSSTTTPMDVEEVSSPPAHPATPAASPTPRDGAPSSPSTVEKDGASHTSPSAINLLQTYGSSDSDVEEVGASQPANTVTPIPSDTPQDTPAQCDAPQEGMPDIYSDRVGGYRYMATYRSGSEESEDSEDDSDSSSSSSDSSSSSSSSSTSTSSKPKPAPEKSSERPPRRARRQEQLLTPGELTLDDLPPIQDLNISVPEHQTLLLGSVHSIVLQQVVVASLPQVPPLDLDTVLFLGRGQRALGRVFDVFGPVSCPLYVVRFNSPEHARESGATPGEEVFYAPSSDHTTYVLLEELMRYKGSDASGLQGNEVGPGETSEFSDDEEEARVMRQLRQGHNTDNSNNRYTSSAGEFQSNRKRHRANNNPFRTLSTSPRPPSKHHHHNQPPRLSSQQHPPPRHATPAFHRTPPPPHGPFHPDNPPLQYQGPREGFGVPPPPPAPPRLPPSPQWRNSVEFGGQPQLGRGYVHPLPPPSLPPPPSPPPSPQQGMWGMSSPQFPPHNVFSMPPPPPPSLYHAIPPPLQLPRYPPPSPQQTHFLPPPSQPPPYPPPAPQDPPCF